MFNWFRSKTNLASQLQHDGSFGYVGKAPWQPDFVKLNLNSREAIGMDHWFREGIARASRRDDWQQGQCLFFMAGSQDEANVIGVSLPSLDSHQRHYPFIGFVLCNSQHYQLHPAALLLQQGRSLSSLHQLTQSLSRAGSAPVMEPFADGLRDIALSLRAPTDLARQFDGFRHLPMSQLWRDIDMHGAARSQFVHNSCQLFRQLSLRGDQCSHLGFRFPMPSMAQEGIYVGAFWLHLIAMRLADRHWRPWFFYQWGDTVLSPSLTVFVRPPAASNFAAIWSSVATNHQVVDIAQLVANGELDPNACQLAELEHMSWFDAIRRWCKC